MINISKRQWRRVRGKLIAKNKQMRRIKSVMFIPRVMQSLYIALYVKNLLAPAPLTEEQRFWFGED